MKGVRLVVAVVAIFMTEVKAKGRIKYLELHLEPQLMQVSSNRVEKITPQNKLYRPVRSAPGCSIPSDRMDSQINCKFYPNKVYCTQTCIFGHSLSDGTIREMKCNYAKNQWTPVKEFDICKPFIDCTLSILPGGLYRCTTESIYEAPRCNISCDEVGDKPVQFFRSYECNFEGKWTPDLPWCIKAGSGLELVPRPKKVENYE